MPRRSKKEEKEEKEESDSDYNEDQETEETDEEQKEGGEGEEKDKQDKPASKPKRQKKGSRKPFKYSEEEYIPTHARKTEKGGYAHTNKSKSRISKANKGNTPWNKGRNRSSADRAKIAAGVRARNRAILLEKLKRLGMSEEEYLQKKLEIKYLRERIRRSKLANAKHTAAEAEVKLKAALDATADKVTNISVQFSTCYIFELAETELICDVFAIKSLLTFPQKPEGKNPEQGKVEEEKTNEEEPSTAFTKDFIWTSFQFSDDGLPYDKVCPIGGPGGLICCDSCSKKYSLYLSRSVKDIEIQRTHKVGTEVKEVFEFVEQGRKTLDRAMGVAKKKVPPLPPPRIQSPESTKPHTRPNEAWKKDNDVAEWNLTSTMDIGDTGGIASEYIVPV